MKGYSVASMGGYSLLAIFVIFFGLKDEWIAPLSIAMIFLANFMNHPHFMASYREFFEIYKNFKKNEFNRPYKARWWFVAAVVPVILIILLSIGVYKALDGNDYVFTIAILLYGASVGWHYVKQGFGMAMSEAALKKCYWQASTRNWMLCNSYACWIFSMCLLFSAEGGVAYFGWMFSINEKIFQIIIIPAALTFFVTSCGMALSVSRNIKIWKKEGKSFLNLPRAGFMGYIASLYFWVVAGVTHPVLMLVIPFFHSLQYMHVIEKIKRNSNSLKDKFFRWAGLIVVGFSFFWLIPGIVDYFHIGKINIISQSGIIFTASIWLFINIHHYFMDNVIWRKENKYIWEKLNAH